MSGVSIPQGMQGIWGGTGAPVGYGGGSSANTIDAVKTATGELKAYDPTTMAGTTKAPTPEAPKFAAAGMDTTGLPSYITNWLAQGGQGSMPTMSNQSANPLGTGTTAAGIDAGGTMLKGSNKATGDDDAAWRASHKAQIDAAAAASQPPPPTAPKTATTPTVTPVQMPQFGPTPLVVNDQWNASTGSSQQVATPGLGAGPNMFNNQLNSLIQPGGTMPQFFSDGKGNFFSDAQGKVPVAANVAQILKSAGVK